MSSLSVFFRVEITIAVLLSPRSEALFLFAIHVDCVKDAERSIVHILADHLEKPANPGFAVDFYVRVFDAGSLYYIVLQAATPQPARNATAQTRSSG